MDIDSTENGNIFVENGDFVSINGKEYVDAVVRWVDQHPIMYKSHTKDSHFWQGIDNNCYLLKHLCERDIGMYVSSFSMANIYMGNGARIKRDADGSFTIYRRPNSFYKYPYRKFFRNKECLARRGIIDNEDWIGIKEEK